MSGDCIRFPGKGKRTKTIFKELVLSQSINFVEDSFNQEKNKYTRIMGLGSGKRHLQGNFWGKANLGYITMCGISGINQNMTIRGETMAKNGSHS